MTQPLPVQFPEGQKASVLRNPTLLAVSAAVGISFAGIGMVVPVRVLYAQAHGASLFIIGAMASSFLLSNFLFQYPAGWLADRVGRKQLMVAGLLIQSVISILYLVLVDPVAFVGLRFLEGMASAGLMPSARALIVDAIPEDRQGTAYGIFGSFLNAGFLIGPALGGLFATASYAVPFIGSCVLRVGALLLVLVLVRNPGRRTAEERARSQAVPARALLTLPLLGAYLLAFGDYIYLGFDQTLMPLWMKHNLGASVAVIGAAYALWAVPNVLGSPLGGHIADRARRSSVILLLGLLQVPMYLAYGLAGAALPVLIIFTLHGAVYALMQPSVDATVAVHSPADARARTQSVFAGVGMVSAFLSANVLTLLYGVSFRLPLFVMGAGFGLCILAGSTLIRLGEGGVAARPAGDNAAGE